MTDLPTGPVGYVGLVTRTVAGAVDALVVNVIAVIFGAMVNLIASLFGHADGLSAAEAIIGGVLWWLWITAYFVSFWTLTGQTPGARILGIRVENANGGKMRGRQALRRFAGTVLALLPLGAGFLPVLVDDKRRALNDRIGGTVVRWRTSDVTVPLPAAAHFDLELEPASVTPSSSPEPTV